MKNITRLLGLLIAFCLFTAPISLAALGEGVDLSGKTVVLYTANVRGDISVYPMIAGLRHAYEESGANVILADAGNYLQGTVYASFDSGKTVIELMSAAGYDVAAIGSHEFDFGTGTVGVEQHEVYYADESFGKLLESASFAATSANIMTGENLELNAYAPVTTVSAGEMTIAFVGLTDPDTASHLGGLMISDVADALSTEHEGRLTVALSNLGTLSAGAADIVIDVSADAGLTVGCVIIDNVMLAVESTQILKLSETQADGELLLAVEQFRAIVDAEYGEGSVVRAAVTLNGAMEDVRSMETNLGDLWTDALYWFATEGGIADYYDEDEVDNGNTGIQVGADHIVAIWNGGNLRDYVHTGDLTMKDIRRVLPYPNKVAVMYLTGAQLLEQLEAATYALPYADQTSAAYASFPQVAGIVYAVDTTVLFDAGEAYGDHWNVANSIGRVTIESINGNPFDADAVYAVITSNAIFNGMDAYYVSAMKDEDLSTITSAVVVDVVWMYIQQKLDGMIGEAYDAPQSRITIIAE